MLCSKCKNPIDVNVTVCEWCGAIIENNQNNDTVKNNKSSSLDDRIVKLLQKEKYAIEDVVKYYIKTTGKSSEESFYHISRLEFFRKYPFATESAWQKVWEKEKKSKIPVGLIILFLFLGIFLLLYFINS